MENILVIFGLTMLGIIFISICNVICFLIGARAFQNVRRDEEIKLPNMNPVEIVKEHIIENREKREADKEKLRDRIMLDNINNYTGDGTGQKDIPS